MPEYRIPDHPDFDEYIKLLEDKKLPELLSARRVAALLDLSPRRVYELVDMGYVAAVRLGPRRLRIFRQSLIDWLRQGGASC